MISSRSSKRKRFRRPFINSSNHRIESGANKAFTQLLLVIAGGVVGIFGNQFFFERNRKLEAKIELQKDFIKQQLPLYNRIINFTSHQEVTGFQKFTYHLNLTKKEDQFGLIYQRDTTVERIDTVNTIFPSFIANSIKRQEFLSDVEEIKKNKDKIHIDVWGNFSDILLFLRNNPLPNSFNVDSLKRTTWAEKKVVEKWDELIEKLFISAYKKLNNPYE